MLKLIILFPMVKRMKKNEYILIANKLWKLTGNDYHPTVFSKEEKELLKQLIKKCNEVEIYEICEIDGSDREFKSETKSEFSFQRG